MMGRTFGFGVFRQSFSLRSVGPFHGGGRMGSRSVMHVAYLVVREISGPF